MSRCSYIKVTVMGKVSVVVRDVKENVVEMSAGVSGVEMRR